MNAPRRLRDVRWESGDRRCPYCQGLMSRPVSEEGARTRHDRMSRDHILPRAWGGASLGGIATNQRFCCQRCNQLRAAAGHCIGALICVRMVAEDRGLLLRDVMREWQFPEIVLQIQQPVVKELLDTGG